MKNKDNWLSALIWFGAAISVAEVEAGREIGANGPRSSTDISSADSSSSRRD